jgi:hypothetical protein
MAMKESFVTSEGKIAARRKQQTSKADQSVSQIRANKSSSLPDCSDDVEIDAKQMEAIGTKDREFYRGLLRQLTGIASQGDGPARQDLSFLLSVIKDIRPKDHVEALLATQLAAVHAAMMRVACQLNAPELSQADQADRVFNRLARTFAALVEALQRCRLQGPFNSSTVNLSREEIEKSVLNELWQNIASNGSRPVRYPQGVLPSPAAKPVPSDPNGSQTKP